MSQSLSGLGCLRGTCTVKSEGQRFVPFGKPANTALSICCSGSPIWRRASNSYSNSEFGRPVHAPQPRLLIMFHVVGCCVRTRLSNKRCPRMCLRSRNKSDREAPAEKKSGAALIRPQEGCMIHTELEESDQSYVEEWRCRWRNQDHTPTATG